MGFGNGGIDRFEAEEAGVDDTVSMESRRRSGVRKREGWMKVGKVFCPNS
jgi:hypothetical protein